MRRTGFRTVWRRRKAWHAAVYPRVEDQVAKNRQESPQDYLAISEINRPSHAFSATDCGDNYVHIFVQVFAIWRNLAIGPLRNLLFLQDL